MKWIAWIALVGGCQADAKQQPQPQQQETTIIQLPKAPVTEAYRADIEALCDCVTRSGADQKPRDERWPIIAMWLGPNIKTTEGHDFLVAIQPLRGEPKAFALETEARRVGLAKCELANEWRQ
jgi:hypothetical protein